ncbi:hypothetical protein [Rhizobium sp. NLR22b]|uniref:hypothetical protein n=1 Tax=Rhizobium sp. NLR22b TaxID=2731115 RepID=UPI001C8381A8|nr:hypothetical protein [Rhizobium sp. NLR22b]MBX5238671.1 hypothetical protein [Rhizobium sp. NLR22b]
MTDIQDRLAEINRRAGVAQAARDRQFFALVGYHLLVIVASLFLFVSIPSCNEGIRQQQLANQENIRHG